MKDIKVLGIDLAKDVFQLHGTDARGSRVLKKRLSRENLLSMWLTLPIAWLALKHMEARIIGRVYLIPWAYGKNNVAHNL